MTAAAVIPAVAPAPVPAAAPALVVAAPAPAPAAVAAPALAGDSKLKAKAKAEADAKADAAAKAAAEASLAAALSPTVPAGLPPRILCRVPPKAKVLRPLPPPKEEWFKGLDPGIGELPEAEPPEAEGVYKGWRIDPAIWLEAAPEEYECEAVDDVKCSDLLAVYDATEFSADIFALWNCEGGTKASIRSALEAVIGFADGSDNTSPGLKNKFLFVVKKLKNAKANGIDPAGILCLLATHGNVCNMQKEVGISSSYSLVNNTLKADLEKQSMHNLLVKLIHQFRVQIMEEMYTKWGEWKNNHSLNAMTNDLIQYTGLLHTPDDGYTQDDMREVQIEAKHVHDWYARYSVETLVRFVSAALNGKSKRIPYDTTVGWFGDHKPLGADKYEFLGFVFDEHTGRVKDEWVLHLLHAHYAVAGPGVWYQPPAPDPPLTATTATAAAPPTAKPSAANEATAAAAMAAETAAVAGVSAGATAVGAAAAAAALSASGLAIPAMKRAVSTDLKMPAMVRAVSAAEEREALLRAESLKLNPARFTADGKCQCAKPFGHCVCLPFAKPNPADMAMAMALEAAQAAAQASKQLKADAKAAPEVAAKAK